MLFFVIPCVFLVGMMTALLVTQWDAVIQLRNLAVEGEPPVDEEAARRLLEIIAQWGETSPADVAIEDLRANLSEEQITGLLVHEVPLVRACAVRALSAVGRRGCIAALLGRLSDREPVVRLLAGGAIQMIWLRLGTPEANDLLAATRRAITHGRIGEAKETVDAAIRESPDFAEAYNQRAIIYFEEGKFALAAIDCEKALSLMPRHYGAMAGLGRCLLRLDDEVGALAAFTLAKTINPNLQLETLITMLRLRIYQRPSAV